MGIRRGLAAPLAFALAACALAVGCTTTKPVAMGIQPEFEAINPSRILAVPVFALPDPARPSEIDGAVLTAENGRGVIERNVLQAFRNQPGVNGVSFQAVRDSLGASPNAWNKLDATMRRTAARLVSTKEGERLSLGKECLARKSFLDFYVHCLSRDKEWIDGLNELSARILNADTAMLTVVTALEKKPEPEGTGLTLRGAVVALLVDTNSGKLIWGRQSEGSTRTTEGSGRPGVATPVPGSGPTSSTESASGSASGRPSGAGTRVPEVGELFPRLLGEEFWAEFPGRRSAETPREGATPKKG